MPNDDAKVELDLSRRQWSLVVLAECLGWGELQGMENSNGEPGKIDKIIERGKPSIASPGLPPTKAVPLPNGRVRVWIHRSWSSFFNDSRHDTHSRLSVLKLQQGLPTSWDWDRGGWILSG